MREVRVTIRPDGTTISDFSGYSGKSCLDVAEQLRRLLAERFGIQCEQTDFVAKPELGVQQEEGKQESRHQQQQGG